MSSVPILALFASTAVLNSGILGVALLWRGRRSSLHWMGLMFLCIGFLLAVYSLEHYDRVWIGGWLRISYDLVSLLLSCFLLEFVFGSLLSRRPPMAIYGSVGAYIIVLVALGGRFLDWFTIDLLVLAQSFYTALAICICLMAASAPWRIRRWNRTWVHAFVISLIFLAVHVAHLLRIFLIGRWDHDIAPIVGIVALIGMTSYALTNTRVSGWVVRRRLGSSQSRELLQKLDHIMRSQRPFVQPQLDLATLARAVGASPQNVSAALNQELGQGFYEYVTAFRVQEAEQLLRDSGRQHLSLEALGTESGFKSRSSFYSAFKAATGLTPGEYRRTRMG